MSYRFWSLVAAVCLSGSPLLAQSTPMAAKAEPFADAPAPKMRVIEIEVTIMQWQKKTPEGEQANSPNFDSADIAALEKSGDLKAVERIRLTTVDQLPAFVQRSERVPLVTSVSERPGGPRQRSVNYQNVGTMVTVTPRIVEDQILVEAKIEQSALVPSSGRDQAEPEDAGSDAAAIHTSQAQTTVGIPPGKTVIVAGSTRNAKTAGEGELILISAKQVK